MEQKKLTMEERIAFAEDVISNPGKYGVTREMLDEWAYKNINAAADVSGKMPESLRDELSDCIIDVYNAHKKKDEASDS